MSYINEVIRPDQSVGEIVPVTITVRERLSTDTNTVAAYRYKEDSTTPTTGIDISARVSITTNVVSLADIFLSGETAETGKYRIKILVTGSTGTPAPITEVNLKIKVI